MAQKDKQERRKGTSFFTFETKIFKGLLLWYHERLLYQKLKLIENGKFNTPKVPFLLMRCYQYRLNGNPGAEREKEIMWKQGKRRGGSAVTIFLSSTFVFCFPSKLCATYKLCLIVRRHKQTLNIDWNPNFGRTGPVLPVKTAG